MPYAIVSMNGVPKNAIMSTFGSQTKSDISSAKIMDADIEAFFGRQQRFHKGSRIPAINMTYGCRDWGAKII